MISVDWNTKIINVPQSYLTALGGDVYELDLVQFRKDLLLIQESEEGMPFVDTHRHNTEVIIAGLTLARVIEIINGYTVEFEDAQYQVNAVGANSNIADVKVLNQVSLSTSNSAGLTNIREIALLLKVMLNKAVTNPADGTYTIYDDDDTAIVLQGDLFEDVAGLTPFDAASQRILRRDRMQEP